MHNYQYLDKAFSVLLVCCVIEIFVEFTQACVTVKYNAGPLGGYMQNTWIEYRILGLGFEVIVILPARKHWDNSILYTARNIKFVTLWGVCNVIILF